MRTTTVRGEAVPTLGFGTWQLRGGDCERAVATALEIGYRHIDTAQAYHNEDAVGRGIVASGVDRGEVFVVTKVTRGNLEADVLPGSVDDSLARLDTDYIDLLLVHWPRPDIDHRATLGAMAALVDAGKVRHIGVSNYSPSLLVEAAEVAEIFCNQVEYHPYLSQERLLELASARDVLLTAYSPLAEGRVLRDPVIREIAEAHGTGATQVTLAWLLAQDHVAAIPKATSRDHIAANYEALDVTLTAAESARISGLAEGRRYTDPGWAPDWGR